MKIELGATQAHCTQDAMPKRQSSNKKKGGVGRFSGSIVEDPKVKLRNHEKKIRNSSGKAKGNKSGKTKRSSSYLNCLTMVLHHFRFNWLNTQFYPGKDGIPCYRLLFSFGEEFS